MADIESIHPSEIFGGQFVSTIERLKPSFNDPVVHRRSIEIMGSTEDDRLSREAQLVVYLAARYALFPEESKIIIDSLKGNNDQA